MTWLQSTMSSLFLVSFSALISTVFHRYPSRCHAETWMSRWPCSPSVNPERIPLSSESWDPVYHILTISCSHNVSGSCWNLSLSLSMSFPGKPGSVNNPSVWAITIRTITYCGNEGVVIIGSCPSWYRKKYCLSGCYMKVIHPYWPIGLENAAALRYIQYTWSVSQTEDN